MVKEDVDYCRMSNLKSGSIDDDPRIRAVDCDHIDDMSTVVLQKKAPQTPQKFKVKGYTLNRVELRWEPPSDDGGSPLLHYLIEYCKASVFDWKEAKRVGPEIRGKIWKFILPLGLYNFRICAVNDNGRSDMVELEQPIRFGCPGPVRSLRAIEIGYTRVKLSWQPPVDDGGSPVKGYLVYNVRGRLMSGETIDTEYLFDGLKEGTQYYFKVVALNRFWEGNPQQLTISTKRSTSPQQPQKFEGSLDQESNTVRLEWSPPDDDGGSPLLSYHIEYCNMSDGEWKEAERVAPDLTQWTRKYDDGSFVYNFRICAENEKGCGERAELKNPIQFHCTGNGKDLHSNKSKRRVKSVSRMDNKEKAYEENFKTFRQYIESCVKVKDLIAFFELFTMEQQQELRHMHRTDPKEAIRQALDYIQQMTGISDKYQCLIRALRDAEYEKVVGILEGQLIPDNDKNRMKIKDSYKHIYKMLSTGDVIAHLYRRKVLNFLDMEEIRVAEQNYGRSDAATELLFMLPRRDRDWFEKFLEALMECQQTDLAALIDKDLSERIQQREIHDNLDLDWDMRSTRSVVSNSSDSTFCDSIESLLDEEITQKNMEDTVALKSAVLNRKAFENRGDIDINRNDPLTASLRVVEKVHRVLIHSQSFKHRQKIKNSNQLLNIICDCDTRLDDLVDEIVTDPNEEVNQQ